MNEKKLVHNFKSYLGFEDSSVKINDDQTVAIEELKPNLLDGELVVSAAHNVLMYTAVSEQQNGRFGSLFITNYKLSFVLSDDQSLGGCRQKNRLLGPYDVPLSLIANVAELSEADECGPGARGRRRSLVPDQGVPNRVKGLQIVCKNMRVMSFGFKFSAQGQGRNIAVSLLHHAFPRRHDLLFAFEYNEPYTRSQDLTDVNMFTKATDWQKEMDRTNCINWRISRANGVEDAFFFGAGDALVVPSTVLDYQLAEAARHFRKGRVPIWVWSGPEGAALARSGELYASNSSGSGNSGAGHAPESTLLEAARGAHPTKKPPLIISLPSRPLQTSFNKLLALCTPTTLRGFWEQDNKFYSSLDNTRWLRYISECLTLAAQAAESLSENITVVLQEGDGMDFCAVISSLTQLLLDSHFRTIKGFQSLIQKEWLSLGHPFCDRLGHVALLDSDLSDGNRSTSPIFLVFLDCTWQLLQQFPTAFQFTEVYLTTLWDSAHNQIFDTFIFNSPRDRELLTIKHDNLRPVWDWHEQFTESEIQYFYNPLYAPPKNPTHPTKSHLPTGAIRLPGLASPLRLSTYIPVSNLPPSPQRLVPHTTLPSLALWTINYLRWLPPLHLPASGDVQMLLFNTRLVREIQHLQSTIASYSSHRRRSESSKESNSYDQEASLCPPPSSVGAFFPFIGGPREEMLALPSDTVSTDGLDVDDQQFDSQSILNGPVACTK